MIPSLMGKSSQDLPVFLQYDWLLDCVFFSDWLSDCLLPDVKLLTAVDQTKDQTLFLSQIPQRALRRTMFPVGGLRKSAVRQMALEAGLEAIVRKKEVGSLRLAL